MPILALDTSTPSPSLAIVHEGRVLARGHAEATPAAGRRVLEEVHGLLQQAHLTARDLTGIVVGTGPGGFTGLRIGLATASGLGQGLGIPVVGAPSLAALALGMSAADARVLVPLSDARRGEVFAAAFSGGEAMEWLRPAAAVPVADLPAWLAGLGGSVAVAGTGAALLGDAPPGVWVAPAGDPMHRIDAAHLVEWVDRAGPTSPTPVYARLPDAEVNRLRAQGTPTT